MTQKNTEASRLRPIKLAKAQEGITALTQLSDYKPQRAEFDLTKAKALASNLKQTADAELAAQIAFNNARDAAAKAEWEVYNFMLGAAEQVIGQYGSNSDEYASLGYKKKSEYKKAKPNTNKEA